MAGATLLLLLYAFMSYTRQPCRAPIDVSRIHSTRALLRQKHRYRNTVL